MSEVFRMRRERARKKLLSKKANMLIHSIEITKEYEYYTGWGFRYLHEGEIYKVEGDWLHGGVVIAIGKGGRLSVPREYFTPIKNKT